MKDLPAIELYLSKDEKLRAKRFLRDVDRDEFIFSHSMLRKIIGAYLRKEPSAISFETNSYGKPFLDPLSNNIGLTFNMSHSQKIVVVSVSRNNNIGIDVEYIKRDIDIASIAEQNFTKEENAYIRTVSKKSKNNAFFLCWTLKEAFIKAIGKGLSYPLKGINTINRGEGDCFRSFLPMFSEFPMRWYKMCFTPQVGYSGAVVIEHKKEFPDFFDFNSSMLSNYF